MRILITKRDSRRRVNHVALAFAYEGTRFDSFARQPGHRTVEGELAALLERGGVFEDARKGRFAVASRTDKGVSAAWNVSAFDSRVVARALAGLSSKAPEGLHLLTATDVPTDFDPRRAQRRIYRYFLPATWHWDRVRDIVKRFEGEHDFSNFRRADAGKSPVASLTRIRFRRRAPGPWLEFEAPFFLWQQVRRLVAAFNAVQSGRKTGQQVLHALQHPRVRADFGVAPPEDLLLVRVDYRGIEFPPATNVVRGRLVEELAASRRRAAWATVALGSVPTVRR